VLGVYGIGVASALTDKLNTGHHHLLIDTNSDEEKQYASRPTNSTSTMAAVRPKPLHASRRPTHAAARSGT
jgi:hypothetical protein